jgi:hypothetical protein
MSAINNSDNEHLQPLQGQGMSSGDGHEVNGQQTEETDFRPTTRRGPQAINIGPGRNPRNWRGVVGPAESSSRRPGSGVSQLPRRTPNRRTPSPDESGWQFRTQEAGIETFIFATAPAS